MKAQSKISIKTIYVIDDDHSFSQSLVQALLLEGYQALAFYHVNDFLQHDILDYAIVLCDMRMPNLSGLDLQSELKRRNKNNPIIFISGQSTVKQAVTAMKAGAEEFLTKPFEPAELMQLLVQIFQKLELEYHLRKMLASLSAREHEALRYFVEGLSNPEVAQLMGIKLATLKEYKSNIFRKLEVSKSFQLIEKFKVIVQNNSQN